MQAINLQLARNVKLAMLQLILDLLRTALLTHAKCAQSKDNPITRRLSLGLAVVIPAMVRLNGHQQATNASFRI